MHLLRQVQAGVSDGRRRNRQFEKEKERHRVHSLLRMRQKLSEKRSINAFPSQYIQYGVEISMLYVLN